jgi:hypothetical protein
MPEPSPTRKSYGNPLLSATPLPVGTINVDGFGLAQAQQSFSLDSNDAAIGVALQSFSQGEIYTYGNGIQMKSYKVSVSYGKGGVATVVVDYMGVVGTSGYTKPQVTGIATSTAQPIEAHPNFTKVTSEAAGGVVLAGYPPSNLVTNNKPIFVQSTDPYATWTFRGFGLRTDGEVNIKAGIRQYLAPLATLRGQIFLGPTATSSASTFLQSVGKRLTNTDVSKLVQPSNLAGALESADQNYALLSAANAECIGNPDNPAAIKVTYDIMVGGEIGWDKDIYGQAPSIL